MKQLLLDKLYKDGKLVSARTNLKFLKRNNLYDSIINFSNFSKADYKLAEIIIAIVNDALAVPECKCGCGELVKINYDVKPKFEFRQYRSSKCAGTASNFKERFIKVDRKVANQKRKATMLEKYGVETNSQRPEIKKIISEKMTSRYLSPDIQEKLNNYEWLYNEYETLGKSASRIAEELQVFYGTVIDYLQKFNFKIRRNYNESLGEIEVRKFVNELGIVGIKDNDQIKPKELDIYIPERDLAIEFNGILWHSSFGGVTKFDHSKKYQLCKEKGIQLLQVFDDEWREKKDIWKSIIKNKLKISPNKVYARKCIVKEINSKEARKFLEENHLHGFVGGAHLGLFYENSIVMSLTYGKSRFENCYEISRICTKIDYTVPGGMSKLLKRLPAGRYTTYSDLRFSTENAYGNTLNYLYTTEPGYFWVDSSGMHRLSRNKTQKHMLAKLLDDKFNPEKSERINMMNAGYHIIHDCGHAKYEFISHQ